MGSFSLFGDGVISSRLLCGYEHNEKSQERADTVKVLLLHLPKGFIRELIDNLHS